MESIEARSYARVGLLGNPSDGYGGAAIAFAFDALFAEMRVEPTRKRGLRVDWEGERVFESPSLSKALATPPTEPDHGALRLLFAAGRQLSTRLGAPLAERIAAPGLHIHAGTTIPLQVGLSGSSAIALCALRALAHACESRLDADALAGLALHAETKELGIAAGPMDRIAQARNGINLMDFAGAATRIESIACDRWPPLFIAWERGGGEASGVVHGRLRERFERGEREVTRAMQRFREIALSGRRALEEDDRDGLAELIDENFALRDRIAGVSERDHALVAIARACNASAKLCGSGGAIVGLAARADDLARIRSAFEAQGKGWLEPKLVAASADAPRGSSSAR